MKTTKKRGHVLLAALALVYGVVLSGCANGADGAGGIDEALIGRWAEISGKRRYLEFKSDGTLISIGPLNSDVYQYTYSTNKGVLTVSNGRERDNTWRYTITRDTLTIRKRGDDIEYIYIGTYTKM
jgi:hypothetical protein